jgi:hypothetical protein
MAKKCNLCIKVQLVLGINNSNSIHELFVRKLSWKFINETNNYKWTLHFHYHDNYIPFIMGAQCGKDFCWRALTMDLVLVTLKVKKGILYIVDGSIHQVVSNPSFVQSTKPLKFLNYNQYTFLLDHIIGCTNLHSTSL